MVFSVGGMGSLSDGGSRCEDPPPPAKEGGEGGYTCHRLNPPSPPSPPPAAAKPHDLYGIVREACAQQNVKWPVECQVSLLILKYFSLYFKYFSLYFKYSYLYLNTLILLYFSP